MIKKSIEEINEMYGLEIPKIVRQIKNKKAGKVLLQFPEGLKPYAQVICLCCVCDLFVLLCASVVVFLFELVCF